MSTVSPNPPILDGKAQSSAIHRGIGRLVDFRPGEGRTILLSGLYFFFILLSYYLLRPVREAMGIQGGADKLPWVMTGTLLAMAAVNPLFSWLVSKYPRRIFIPTTYHFFAVNMLIFFGLFHMMPESWHKNLGYAFYIWLSVFNLFVVSVFWGFSADLYSREQAKRLFGVIAIGGTVGAITGAAVTGALVNGFDIERFGLGPYLIKVPVPAMLLVAIVPLEMAVLCVTVLVRRGGFAKRVGASGTDASPPKPEPGPGMWKGLEAIAASRYLKVIAIYMLLFSVSSTFLYIEQGRIVEAAFPDRAQRTAAFADIDLWANLLTLATQLLFTGRIIGIVGIGGALCILPLLTLIGFAVLWQNPTLTVLMWFQVIRRGVHYAVDRPAREVLYTVLGPDEKYKTKSFIDTFVYRAGDMIGGWAPVWWASGTAKAMGAAVGLAIGWIAVPVSIAWLGVALVLGKMQGRQKGAEQSGSRPQAH